MKSSFVVYSTNRTLGNNTFTLPINAVTIQILYIHSACINRVIGKRGNGKLVRWIDDNRTVHQLQFPPWGLSVGQEISGSNVN